MPLTTARVMFSLTAFAAGIAPRIGIALTDPSALCLHAATEASRHSGVPLDVLIAVSLVETGREGRPWPWTVNVGGEGHWFDSKEEAEAQVQSVLDQGQTNVDLGCFQLNHRWHGAAFASVSDMLDPDQNAAYAADFLARNYAETGDWPTAAAAYHSATPEFAERYQAKFEATYAALDLDAPPPPEDRLNSFPLLLAGQSGRNGSLVPATSGGSRLIGGP